MPTSDLCYDFCKRHPRILAVRLRDWQVHLAEQLPYGAVKGETSTAASGLQPQLLEQKLRKLGTAYSNRRWNISSRSSIKHNMILVGLVRSLVVLQLQDSTKNDRSFNRVAPPATGPQPALNPRMWNPNPKLWKNYAMQSLNTKS